MTIQYCIGCGKPMSFVDMMEAGNCLDCGEGPLCDDCTLCEECAEMQQAWADLDSDEDEGAIDTYLEEETDGDY
jgi:hypothetical protein